MKRAVVFLSFFLLLGVVSISGTGNIAFAATYTPPPLPTPGVVVLYCTVSSTTTPPSFIVSAVSIDTTASITLPTDCAAALVTLKEAGFVIRDDQALNTNPVSIVYTLVNRLMEY